MMDAAHLPDLLDASTLAAAGVSRRQLRALLSEGRYEHPWQQPVDDPDAGRVVPAGDACTP
ncbi:hypothetical protein ACTVCO_05035 [Sanguibacter sp. A247]|uniref:hypothetical protein n=1 Tax=unclassified Sanguibacter TaxID=2645534 RepID=UPI003FD71EFA